MELLDGADAEGTITLTKIPKKAVRECTQNIVGKRENVDAI